MRIDYLFLSYGIVDVFLRKKKIKEREKQLKEDPQPLWLTISFNCTSSVQLCVCHCVLPHREGTFQLLCSLGLTVPSIRLAWTNSAVDHVVQIFLRKTLRLLITKDHYTT